MPRSTPTRRTFLGATAAITAGLAGCSGGSGGGSGDGSGGSDGSGGDGGGSGDGGSTPSFDGYLSGTSNYDGVVDQTGSDEVTVTVGAEANGGNFGFGPAAVRVSAGTTVVWEWNGKGSLHNVVAEDGSFESEQVQEAGHTFSQTFEEPGTVKYYCTPHETIGMKGVVVVEE
ncbi:halocyanin domain-containing protein [Halobellus limi]|uniref:Halocyanin domain-containing protein n=1 Tax=Halobellus limi TaxID=699433 RepID=A0A1H6AWB5_9EURY|nr:halocyanin domain-containing protein [Halobellus limi]QCC47788.1 halocyanin domain-containing protein [Halobellus limi]SEG52692.1 halocyanin domain-containing protein [Halobellus limi]